MTIDVYDDVNIDSSIFKLILDTKQELETQGELKPCFHQIFGRLNVENWFFEYAKKRIKARDFWHNFICFDSITRQKNYHEWHEDRFYSKLADSLEQRLERISDIENHADGEYTCVIWVEGEHNKGGDFMMLTNLGIQTIEFRKHRMIVFPVDAVHKVEEYLSREYRISAMFTFDYLE